LKKSVGNTHRQISTQEVALFLLDNEDDEAGKPLDPDLLHLVCGLSQAGRVSDHEWEPTDI
jgi:hypothetical protein